MKTIVTYIVLFIAGLIVITSLVTHEVVNILVAGMK